MEYGWLKREATSPDEVQSLLGIVERGLADAKVETISTDLRFIAAFNSALVTATAALRAVGYRVSSQSGHHLKTIESLEFTLPGGGRFVQRFKVLSNKRNRSSYDAAGMVSDQDLKSVTGLAIELREKLRAWLREEHPRLLNE